MCASTVPGAFWPGFGGSPRLGVPSFLNTPGALPGAPGWPPGRLRVPTPQSSPRCKVGLAPGGAFGVTPAPGCAPGVTPVPGAGAGGPPATAEGGAVAVPGAVACPGAVDVPGCAPGVVPREGIGISRNCALTEGTLISRDGVCTACTACACDKRAASSARKGATCVGCVA